LKESGLPEDLDYIPTRNLFLTIDSAKVIENGTVKAIDADKIVKKLEITLKGNGLNKSELMLLDIISTNNWERPIYFGIGIPADAYMGLEKYFQLEGAAYRLLPIETKVERNDFGAAEYGRIDTDILYDHVMNQFVWGNIKNPDVNIDHFHDNIIGSMQYRNTFQRLAKQLIQEGQKEKAVQVLDKSLEELPISQIPIDIFFVDYISLYYALGEMEKGNHLLNELAEDNCQMLKYINSLSPKFVHTIQREENISLYILQSLFEMAQKSGQDDLCLELKNKIESIYNPHIVTTPPAQSETPKSSTDTGKAQ
jgi:tetratricopeptide (TPR) repeat protein